jgi:hypothetical protein
MFPYTSLYLDRTAISKKKNLGRSDLTRIYLTNRAVDSTIFGEALPGDLLKIAYESQQMSPNACRSLGSKWNCVNTAP